MTYVNPARVESNNRMGLFEHSVHRVIEAYVKLNEKSSAYLHTPDITGFYMSRLAGIHHAEKRSRKPRSLTVML